jgi:hypothetical protein
MKMHIDNVVDLVMEHCQLAKVWGRKTVQVWSKWFINNEFYKAVADSSGNLIGVAFARPVSSLEMATNPYAYDENGPICFVDCIVSTDKQSRKDLVQAAISKRFAKCNKIGFRRDKANGKDKFSIYSYKSIEERFK